MLHIRKIFSAFLLAVIIVSPRPSHAALIRTYDLDSLCYKSTDVVVATLVRQRPAGQLNGNYDWGAKVVASIEGQYRPGDIIMPVSIDLLSPPPFGPRCILFVARHPSFFQQPTWTETVTFLYTDTQNHVRRYYQWGDPGGQEAEGYFPPGIPRTDATSDERNYPTFANELKIIKGKWTEVDKLRPLLSHDPRPEDVSVLLDLLRHRPDYDKVPFQFQVLTDGIAEAICSRLADLNDPSIALDALSIKQGRDAGVALEFEPFRSPASLAYAQSVAQDMRQPEARRKAAAEVLRLNTAKL